MIDDLDETIRRLILTKGRFDPDSVEVSFDQPTGDWAAGLTRPTIDCYLYDIRENLELRSAEWLVGQNAQGLATKRLAPRRYDFSYLVTVWTQSQTDDEHAILWRVLATLASYIALPKDLCQRQLAQQPYPIKAQTAQPSTAIESLPDLWGVMENALRPSINYVVTLAMEREISFTSPLVLTKRVEVAVRGEMPSQTEEILQIAGIISERGETARPVAGVEITLLETGRSTKTDLYGRYSFSNVRSGTCHLRLLHDGKSTEHTLVIPSLDHDAAHYDLRI